MGTAGPTSCPWPTGRSLHFFSSPLAPSDSERTCCPINWLNYKGSCYWYFQRSAGLKPTSTSNRRTLTWWLLLPGGQVGLLTFGSQDLSHLWECPQPCLHPRVTLGALETILPLNILMGLGTGMSMKSDRVQNGLSMQLVEWEMGRCHHCLSGIPRFCPETRRLRIYQALKESGSGWMG